MFVCVCVCVCVGVCVCEECDEMKYARNIRDSCVVQICEPPKRRQLLCVVQQHRAGRCHRKDNAMVQPGKRNSTTTLRDGETRQNISCQMNRVNVA